MSDKSVNPVAYGDPAPVVVSAIALHMMGGLVVQMSPFVVAGLMTGLALSERDAGIVTSVELLALAATAISLAPFLSRLSYRRTGLLALLLTLIAQAASILDIAWTALVMLRGLAGVGEGALYALSLGIVASRCSNPEKIFGYFQFVCAIASVALFSIGGEITAAFAHRGIFALLAGVMVIFAPLVLLVSNAPDVNVNKGPSVAGSPTLLGFLLFLAIVLYVTVSAGLFTFSGPLGQRVGLDTGAVGYILTLSSLIGLAGAGAATMLNVHWGRTLPISAFCFGYILVVLVLCLWRDPRAYAVAVIASAVLYYFSLPYLFGLAAALDRSGRWAAAAGSAHLLGFAIGPMLAGAMIAGAGYASLAALCVVMMMTAWGLAMLVLSGGFVRGRRADRYPDTST